MFQYLWKIAEDVNPQEHNQRMVQHPCSSGGGRRCRGCENHPTEARFQQRIVEQFQNIPVPEIVKEIVEIVKLIPQERIQTDLWSNHPSGTNPEPHSRRWIWLEQVVNYATDPFITEAATYSR